MTFQTWAESNSEAKKVLLPDFGLRTLNDIKFPDRKVMWQHLMYSYFFEREPVPNRNSGKKEYVFYGNEFEQKTKLKRIIAAIAAMTLNYKANNYAPKFLLNPDNDTACSDFVDIFTHKSEHVVLELLSLYAKAIVEEPKAQRKKL